MTKNLSRQTYRELWGCYVMIYASAEATSQWDFSQFQFHKTQVLWGFQYRILSAGSFATIKKMTINQRSCYYNGSQNECFIPMKHCDGRLPSLSNYL